MPLTDNEKQQLEQIKKTNEGLHSAIIELQKSNEQQSKLLSSIDQTNKKQLKQEKESRDDERQKQKKGKKGLEEIELPKVSKKQENVFSTIGFMLSQKASDIKDTIATPFKAISNVITSIVGKIGEFIGFILNSIGTFAMSIAKTIGILLSSIGKGLGVIISSIGKALLSFIPFFTALANPATLLGFAAFIAGLYVLALAAKEAEKPLIALANVVKDTIIGVVKQFGVIIVNVINAVLPQIARFKDAIIQIMTVLGSIVLPALIQLGTLIKDILFGVFDRIFGAFMLYMQTILNFVRELIVQVLGVIMPFVSDIIQSFGIVIVNILKVVTPLLEPIILAFKELAKVVLSLIPPIMKALVPVLNALTPIIQTLANLLIQLYKTVFPVLQKILKRVVLPIVEKMIDLWKIFAGIIKEVVIVALNTLKDIFPVIGGIIKTVISPIETFIKSSADVIKSVVKNITDVMMKPFETIETIVNSIENIIGNVLRDLPILIDALKMNDKEKKETINAWDAIGGGAKSLVTITLALKDLLNAYRNFKKMDLEVSPFQALRNILIDITALSSFENVAGNTQKAIDNIAQLTKVLKDPKTSKVIKDFSGGIGDQIKSGVAGAFGGGNLTPEAIVKKLNISPLTSQISTTELELDQDRNKLLNGIFEVLKLQLQSPKNPIVVNNVNNQPNILQANRVNTQYSN